MRSLANAADMKSGVRAHPVQRSAVVARSQLLRAKSSGRQQRAAHVAAGSAAAPIRPQQALRSSHIVCVAAQEAPAAQQKTATQVCVYVRRG
jgi:hypothetical protein